MTIDDQTFLQKLSLADLLGLSKLDETKSTKVTAKFWERLVENFLKNILPEVVTAEELDVLSKAGQNSPEFDTLFGQLVDKYPDLQRKFEESFIEYKAIILRERLDLMRRENVLDEEEYATAKELANKEAWQNLYEEVISLKDTAGLVFTPN